MIREVARPNALSRVSLKVAQHQLPEMAPIKRNFVSILNNGDNTITITSNKGHNFPRICKIPFRTHNGEIITTHSFPDRQTGEIIETIVVFNEETKERESFRSPAFFWVYSQEENFDIGLLSEVGFQQAEPHLKNMYTNAKNPTQYWMKITNYPDDNKTLIIESNSDGRYPIAVRSQETNYGQVIKRKGKYIEIDGVLHNSPVFRWVYMDLNEPFWDIDSIQDDAEQMSWNAMQEKLDDHREWHVKETYVHREDEEETYYKSLKQEQAYDYYFADHIPTASGDVLKAEEDTSLIQFPEENNNVTETYISRSTEVSLEDAATIRKHIHNLVGNDQVMVALMIEGLRGKVIFPDKTPTVKVTDENGKTKIMYIHGKELIRFNCKWIYFLSQEMFALENDVSEDVKLSNTEEYQQAMRDITEILSFSQDHAEYDALIDKVLENNLEHHHKEVNGVETMNFPSTPPERKEPIEIEEEDETPSVRSHYYSKIDENNWQTKTKRSGNLTHKWNPQTFQHETFIDYKKLPEYKYNLM